MATHTSSRPGRPPRIIFNNDGGDAVIGTLAEITTPEGFLETRMSALAGTHVDVISYCTCIGLGVLRHKTRVGSIPPVGEDGKKNKLLHTLLEQGTDPLQVTVGFAHDNGMGAFWSMRMNDTHDGGARNWDFFQSNEFKVQNPDCLIGRYEDRENFRKWSAANYDNPKVHEAVLSYVEEVLETVPVEGIELDFFRHPVFFRETIEGIPVSDEQRDKMSELIRSVRAMIDAAAVRRKQSLTLAVRTPDDPDYARAIGLDIAHWMRSGWLDIYIPSCYFRLRSWRDAVQLGHRHGVKVYAGLSDSRVGGGHHKHLLRSSDEGYRARAACAWEAGVDGIYVFNFFDPHRRIWSEIGEPAVLDGLDKLYFASDLGARRVPGGGYPYRTYQQIPALCPENPIQLEPAARTVVPIDLAESDDRLKSEPRVITAHVQCAPSANLQVVFNGCLLECGGQRDNVLGFPLRPEQIRRGSNSVEITNLGDSPVAVEDLWVAVRHEASAPIQLDYLDATQKRM